MATSSKKYTIRRKVSDTEEEIVRIPYNALADTPDLSVYAKLSGGNAFTGNQQFNQGGYWFATAANHPFVVELENGDALITVNPNGVSFDSDGLGTTPLLINGNTGTDGQVLTSQGASKTPKWGDVSYDNLTDKPTNLVTTDTEQEISSVKKFTNEQGLMTNAIENLNGNRVYDFDSTNNRFGSLANPTHIRGSESRPKYEMPDGNGNGGTVKKDVALADDVPTKTSQLTNDSDYATTSEVDAKYTKPSSGIPKTDLAGDVQTSLDKADTALQSAPVTSVNGKTGAVTIDVPPVVQATGTSTSSVMSQKAVTDGLNAISNPNLLINPNFAINQRGQTSYTGAVYGVDRWKGIASAVTATPVTNGIEIQNSGTGNTYLKQIVETNLAGKTVTASCKLSAINSGEGGRFAVYWSTNGTSWTILNSATITTTGITSLTATIPSNAVYMSVDVGVRPSSDVVFDWAKLEIGSVATEFLPPTIAEELQKCYRYYKKITNLQKQNYTAFGIVCGDGSGARMIFENTFRANPTITTTGAFSIVANDTVYTISAIAMQSFNSTNIVVKFTLNSAMTEGVCGYLQSNNSVGAYIAFDAEL